jgi:hypothetical protein
MSLKDDLETLKVKTPSCIVGRVLEAIDLEDAHALDEILKDRTIPSTKIAHILEKYGYKMSSKTVDRHRNIGTTKTRCACL